MAQGLVLKIQPFSIHDGPGIRTTVFLKGCNLRCFWCHNPESRKTAPEIQSFPQKCIGCGKCAAACPTGAIRTGDGRRAYDPAACRLCGACVNQCWAESLLLAGQRLSSRRVLEEVLRDRRFHDSSGGGVTLSGGEPLLQPDFTLELLKESKQHGLHTAIDTALHVEYDLIRAVVPYLDLVLLDIKTMDAEAHVRATGVPNGLILENARRLSGEQVRSIVRIPVVPGVNDSDDNIRSTAEYVKGFPNLEYLELLAFHKTAVGKYKSLGLSYGAEAVEDLSVERMQHLQKIIGDYGLQKRL